jgi:hypothetical protein
MSLNDRNYEEKRDFIRMRVDADVRLIHEGEQIQASCIDLSSSGMQVEVPRQFDVGHILSVEIQSDHTALKGLKARTQVVWVMEEEEGTQRLGLRILAME